MTKSGSKIIVNYIMSAFPIVTIKKELYEVWHDQIGWLEFERAKIAAQKLLSQPLSVPPSPGHLLAHAAELSRSGSRTPFPRDPDPRDNLSMAQRVDLVNRANLKYIGG